MTYAEKLKDPRWQKKRLYVLERDEWTCQYCGDTKTEFHVHHKRYNGNPWDADDDDLITICRHCHEICEHAKEFEGGVTIEQIRKIPGKATFLHFVVIAIGETERWSIFYKCKGRGHSPVEYVYGISESVIIEIYNAFIDIEKR